MKGWIEKVFGTNEERVTEEEILNTIIEVSKKEPNDFRFGERVRTIIQKFKNN
jgi:hypothetical protein